MCDRERVCVGCWIKLGEFLNQFGSWLLDLVMVSGLLGQTTSASRIGSGNACLCSVPDTLAV